MEQGQKPDESSASESGELAEGKPGRSLFRSVLSLVLLIGSLAYVGRVLWVQRAELVRAFELSPAALVALFLLMGVSHAQRTYEFTYMLRRLGVREPFVDGFLLTGAGFLLNHLPLNVGLVMRAAVLKRDHALPYASYLSLVMVNALINLAVAALLGLASVAFTEPFRPAEGFSLIAAFSALLALALGAVFLPLNKLPFGESFVGRRLRLLAKGVSLIRGNGSGVLLLSTLAFTKVVGAAFRMWICFGLLGADVSPLAAGLLASATIVFSLVSLTPGNLGLREVAMAAISTTLGATYGVGMAAASIDRVVLLAYTVVTGVPQVSIRYAIVASSGQAELAEEAVNKALTFLRKHGSDLLFFVLSLGILGWVAWDAVSYRLITYSPGADYWEHTAVLRALLEDPWHPKHPLIVSPVSSPRFGPHFLFIALLGRAFGTDALGAMSIAAILNTLLFLLGIYLFFREYFRDPRASLFGLVVMFGSWLDAPHFSNVYKLAIYFSVDGYPSSAALAVMLLGLTMLLRLLRSERDRPGLWALSAFSGAYLYITHPLTAMLAFTAAGLLVVTEPAVPRRRRLWALGSIVGGLFLASLWPYYPALGMVASGTAARVQKGLEAGAEHALHPFYEVEKLVGILGFCLLVVPFFPYLVWRRKHLVVPLGTVAMLAVFAASPFLDIPLGHRFVLLAVFFLQIGLVWLLLAALSSPFREPTEAKPRYVARLAAALAASALLAVMAVAAVADAEERFAHENRGETASPTVRYARRVAELAGPNAIILAEPLPSWPLPTFGPKVVTLHHRNPLIPDGAERDQAARRFFAAKTPEAERQAILAHFGVTHVVFSSRNSPAVLRFLEAHGKRRGLPLGRLLFELSPDASAPIEDR